MLELFTFRISHFSEKARWLLDASGTEYRETFWTPFFHVAPALRRSRRATTVPILRHPGGHVQDSTQILLWLERNMPGFALLPRESASRAEALDIVRRFDRVGHHVVRCVYAANMDDAPLVIRLWTFDANALQRRVIRATFPLLRAAFRRRFDLSPRRVEQSREVIQEAFDYLDARLADGREYLVGDRLSAADITACALLAPLVGPEEHEVYARNDVRERLAPQLGDWLSRPSADWVRRRYRQRAARPAAGRTRLGD